MFDSKTLQKTSVFAAKRQQLRKQIRRDYLNVLFESKRKQKLRIDICIRQKQIYLENFSKLLQNFFDSQNDQEAEKNIKAIFAQLARDNVDIESAVKLEPEKLVKVFIMFPHNRYAVQILFVMIKEYYEYTFGMDDIRFGAMHGQDIFDVILERKEMTSYQQALDILMKTIDQNIPELRHRRKFEEITDKKQFEKIQSSKNLIEKRIKMYLGCLAELSLKVNTFISRSEYVNKYLTKWTKWLLIDFEFGRLQIIKYISSVSRFLLPFESMKKISRTQITKQQAEVEEEILYKLFNFCVPQTEYQASDKIEFMSLFVIESLFSYDEVKIEIVIKYLEQLTFLLKVVLNKMGHFRTEYVKRMFNVMTNVISKFVVEQESNQTTLEQKQLMESIDFVRIMKDMEFLNTFSLYLQYQQWAIGEVFKMITALIEYSLAFGRDPCEVIEYKNFFTQICHKLYNSDVNVTLTNLRSLTFICRYAEIQNRMDLFGRMVYYGVDQTLENLCYSIRDDFEREVAQELHSLYFNQQRIQAYTNWESGKERDLEEMFIPNKYEVYDNF